MFKWLKNLFVDKEAEERRLRELRLQTQSAEIVNGVVAAQARERKGVSQNLTVEDVRRESGTRFSLKIVPAGGDGMRFRRTSSPKEPIKVVVRDAPASVKPADFSSVKKEKNFAQLLNGLVNAHCGGVPSTCYSRAGVRRQTYSKIISTGGGNVTKRIAMQLCIGAHANIREAMELLESAGYAFSKASYEDAVFRWCLENGVYSMTYLNELLVHCNCKPCDLVF